MPFKIEWHFFIIKINFLVSLTTVKIKFIALKKFKNDSKRY